MTEAIESELLHRALLGSRCLLTTWHVERLVGVGHATSDGRLIAHYPDLLVLPFYQSYRIGTELMWSHAAHDHWFKMNGKSNKTDAGHGWCGTCLGFDIRRLAARDPGRSV
jgi:hypothetical protein